MLPGPWAGFIEGFSFTFLPTELHCLEGVTEYSMDPTAVFCCASSTAQGMS